MILSIILLLLVTSVTTENSVPTRSSTVNAIIGDASYIAEFGKMPETDVDEALRLRTHLSHVEQILRSRNTDHLSTELKEKRSDLLDLLHQYWNAGIFPRNYDHPDQRRPCFIDRDGNICAVGFLVEKTAGREAAEQINARHQYDLITDMDLARLDDWIAGSGLTLEECAMIQPTYGYYPYPDNEIGSTYAIPSALLTGVNVSMLTLNSIQVLTNSDNSLVPIVGMVTGAGQIALGVIKYPKNFYYTISPYPTFNKTERDVSLLNIGLGTATMVMSTFNLVLGKNKTKTSWNVFSYPATEVQSGIGLAMVRRF